MKYVSQVLFFIIGCFSASAFSNLGGGIYQSDGSASDTQSAINSASGGNTVLIPAGSFTWSTTVTLSKPIKLQGAGSGRVIGQSASTVAVGTGSKTFTTQSGLGVTIGETLKVERTGTVVSGGSATGTRAYMIGTVTSYSGTSLTLNVTATTGSGTQPLWIISTMPSTIITQNGSGNCLQVTESTSGNVDISGIFWQNGASGTGDMISIAYASAGKPVLIHDCYFESSNGTSDCIQANANRGVIWNCSFSALPFSMAQLGIHAQSDSLSTSWTSASTWGMNDADGTHALYIENCDFNAWLNATDFDDNSRAVVRYCTFNNAGLGTHGADTSNYGNRYFEAYHDTFIFNGFNDGQTLNLNWWFFIRGGTFLVTDCLIPALSSTDYGTKPSYALIVMNLQRGGGPNPCWGAGIAGNQYPAPRQVGMGYVTGTGVDGLGRHNDSISYVGDSEPVYIWNNTGTGASSVGIKDYGGSDCGSPDNSANYIVSGRDYFVGTAKPGYSEYTYPHPLRTGNGGGSLQTYSLVVNSGSGSGTYNSNTVVQITANAIFNEIFANWSGLHIANTNLASTTVSMPASNLTVTANFVPYPPTQLKPAAGQ
jgi:hypothetical protein